MSNPRIGVSFGLPDPRAMLAAIQRAEELGVPKVWVTTGAGADGLTLFAAAAVTTSRIHLGTAIVHAWTRHPLTMAQQAADVAQFAPGRLTLGIGPGAQITMERRFGLAYARPLEYLREYVTVVKAALRGERVDFEGKRITVHGGLNYGADVPVIISALQAGSFELAGEVADGAVTWACAAPYIRDVARPAMERGAQKAGRPVPQLIGQAFVCLTSDEAEGRKAGESQVGFYARSAYYQAMFAAAGFPEAREGVASQRMIDALVLRGDETAAAHQVQEFLSVSGADQLVLTVLPVGEDRAASIERALKFIGEL